MTWRKDSSFPTPEGGPPLSSTATSSARKLPECTTSQPKQKHPVRSKVAAQLHSCSAATRWSHLSPAFSCSYNKQSPLQAVEVLSLNHVMPGERSASLCYTTYRNKYDNTKLTEKSSKSFCSLMCSLVLYKVVRIVVQVPSCHGWQQHFPSN